jgi:hypothetical protein
MPAVTFYHPDIPSSKDGRRPGPYLAVNSGLEEASWSYNLNTVTFPTYGGEVVQILSCNIGELTITGTLPSYRAMERVYAYFAYYLQIATQGRNVDATSGKTAYNQTPIVFTYPERGWTFQIMPTALRRFKYGNDIVAPSWGITAHIVDHSEDMHDIKEFTKHQVLDEFLKSDGEKFELEGKIGFLAENPFSAFGTIFDDDFDPKNTREEWKKSSDRFNEVIEAYLDSDLESLYETLASRPAWGDLQNKAGQEAADKGRKRADQEIDKKSK